MRTHDDTLNPPVPRRIIRQVPYDRARRSASGRGYGYGHGHGHGATGASAGGPASGAPTRWSPSATGAQAPRFPRVGCGLGRWVARCRVRG
jgi:hypothetical protein